YRGRLKLPANAQFRDLRLRKRTDIGHFAENHAAFAGTNLSANHVEQGRLPGAVRTDDDAKLAAVHDEIQVVERLEPLEADRHALEIDDGFGHFNRPTLQDRWEAWSRSAGAWIGGRASGIDGQGGAKCRYSLRE